MKSSRAATRILTGVACIFIVPVVSFGSEPVFRRGRTSRAGRRRAARSARLPISKHTTHARRPSSIARSWPTLARWPSARPDSDSEVTYRAALDLAVARGLYSEAEPIARAYLAHERGEHENYALATSIMLIMDAERGEFDKSFAEVKEFLKQRAAAEIADEHRLPAPLVCAVGEAYLQRLVRGGRYDIARQVCSLLARAGIPTRPSRTTSTTGWPASRWSASPRRRSKEQTSTASPCGLPTTRARSS